MKRIELEIVADNSKFINSTREVGKATDEMSRKTRKHYTDQRGLIEQATEDLKKLEAARRKTQDPDKIKEYNKAIANTKKELDGYNKAGLETVATEQKMATATNTLWNSFKKLLAPILTVTAVIKAFKAIMASTEETANLLRKRITGVKFAADELWRSIATGNMDDLLKRMKEAQLVGENYAETIDHIENRENALAMAMSDREVQMAKLAKIYRNTAASEQERIDAAEEYIKLAEQNAKDEIEIGKIRLDNELSIARQALGLTAEFEKAKKDANQAEMDRINNIILNNIRSQKSFEENAEAYEKYAKLQSDLAKAEYVTTATAEEKFELAKNSVVATTESVDELKKQIEAVPPEIKNTYDEYLKWGIVSQEVRKKITSAYVDINRKVSEFERGTIRANVVMERNAQKLLDEETETNKDRLNQAEKFSKELQTLWEQYSKSQIESLTGEEQIRAQEAFTIAQIDAEEKKLKELGEINEEGIKMLEALRLFAHKKALKDIKQYNADQLAAWEDTYRKASNALLDNLDFRKNIELQALELSGKATEAKRLEIENKYLAAQRDLYLKAGAMYDPMVANWIQSQIDANEKLIKSADFDIWRLLDPEDNLGDEKRKAIEDAFKETVNNVIGILDTLYSNRVEDTQRNRELLETQISETQDALNAEIELAQLGYANNVAAKQKELAELKKSRDNAIKEEQKAIEAQRKFETAMQTMSLITSSANIIKSLTAAFGAIGLLLAVPAIASMWALFAKSKSQAAQATKLAEGGVGTDTGIVKGRSHAEGGEPFLQHVEVERGEMWGVLSKPATRKYGKQFAEIVTSFNKDNLSIDRQMMPDNNIVVDVNQTNERLDKVEYQLIKLNRHFGGKKDIHEMGNIRIEKIGNKTRIIRNNAL